MENEKRAWIAGNESADRILRETITTALATLSEREFLIWLRDFLGIADKEDK